MVWPANSNNLVPSTCCRAAGDSNTEAELLLQQARLEALAGRPEAAILLLQAAQALGGSAALWRDSVALYATVRGAMRSGGQRDAAAALEAGVAMMQALARWGGCCLLLCIS